MTETAPSSVVSFTLSQGATGRTGRAFVDAAAFPQRSLQELIQAVQLAFDSNFDDEDDAPRLDLVNSALRREAHIPVELYPSESAPVRWEAFLRFRVEASDPPESISACMIFPMVAVVERLARAPHWFTESSVLQVVDDAGSDVEVAAALQVWVRRNWPEVSPPVFHVERWPRIGARHSVRKLPQIAADGALARLPEPSSTTGTMHSSTSLLSDYSHLRASETLDRTG